MFQILVTLAIYMLIVIPMGIYLFKVATYKKTFADPVFNRIDNTIYKIGGIDIKKGMNWKKYVCALLITNFIMMIIGYIILRVQSMPIFNPNGIENMEASLSLNTIISFMTNTNLQHYAGESSLSNLSQMAVITFMMFVSAASGYAVCVAFVRGLTGKDKWNMGNFYSDLVRIITRILLPLSIAVCIFLVWQGVPQTFSANITATTIEGTFQDIALGPVATLEAIKHIGTNGGGFFGANSATPFENPTIWSNLAELFSMMILPGACVVMFGKMVSKPKVIKPKDLKKKSRMEIFGGEGKTVFTAMSTIFIVGLVVCFFAEMAGNPLLGEAGLSQAMGSMEGKEVRFGVSQSALFTTTTTSFTTGTVNNMHDTLTPLGGFVAMLHMMLNLVFGGKGVGLMNMVIYVLLTVFICGLMIGRTPEYLGKKVEGKEMKLVALSIIIHPLLILGFTAIAVSTQAGMSAVSNDGFHGLSQILYEFSSSAANNGSGFEGLADNNLFWNITTAIAMFFGRYAAIIIQMAIAGSLMSKQRVNETVGTLQTNTMTFTISLVVIIYIFAALTFFPVLCLGPVAEHLVLWA